MAKSEQPDDDGWLAALEAANDAADDAAAEAEGRAFLTKWLVADAKGRATLRQALLAEDEDAGSFRTGFFRMLDGMSPEERRSLNDTRRCIRFLEMKVGVTLDHLRRLAREYRSDPTKR
jgi:hypothetical protein